MKLLDFSEIENLSDATFQKYIDLIFSCDLENIDVDYLSFLDLEAKERKQKANKRKSQNGGKKMKKQKQFLLTAHDEKIATLVCVRDRLEANWGDEPDFEEWIWNKTHHGLCVRLIDRANHIVNIYRSAGWNDETIDDLLIDSFTC